jgi:hypothetical protein
VAKSNPQVTTETAAPNGNSDSPANDRFSMLGDAYAALTCRIAVDKVAMNGSLEERATIFRACFARIKANLKFQ